MHLFAKRCTCHLWHEKRTTFDRPFLSLRPEILRFTQDDESGFFEARRSDNFLTFHLSRAKPPSAAAVFVWREKEAKPNVKAPLFAM